MRAVLLASAIVLLLSVPSVAASTHKRTAAANLHRRAAAAAVCTRNSGNPSGGVTVKPSVTLSSSGPADPINLGGSRGIGATDIVVSASPPLPSTVKPEQITLDVPKRFLRNGSKLTTKYLDQPTFSTPRILEGGKLIAFSLCVDASHISAGSYVGQVIVGGPVGIQAATVAISLNAKDHTLFISGMVLAGLAAFFLLALKAAKEKYAALQGADKRVGKALAATGKDVLGFWAPTLFALGAALGAMTQVYDGDVAWGADASASMLALAGTAISAAGLGTFLSSLKGT